MQRAGVTGGAVVERQHDLFAEKLAAKFAEFDAAHPDVWTHFCRFAHVLIERRVPRYSADAILHRIRWEYVTSAHGSTTAKPVINNNWAAFYARRWREQFPQHADLFEVRKSVADEVDDAV